MKVKLLLLCAFTAISTAFIIPSGTTNGLYQHTLHPNGTHMHTFLAALPLPLPLTPGSPPTLPKISSPHSLSHRSPSIVLPPFTTATCGNGAGRIYSLPKPDVDMAISQFQHGCSSAVDLGDAGTDLYSVHGEAVVFMCNYGGRWCKVQEWEAAWEMLRVRCGAVEEVCNTGYVMIWLWEKSYGLDRSNNNVCR